MESLPQKLSENGRIQESAFLYCVAVQNSTHSYTQSSDLMKEDGEGARVYLKKKNVNLLVRAYELEAKSKM